MAKLDMVELLKTELSKVIHGYPTWAVLRALDELAEKVAEQAALGKS